MSELLIYFLLECCTLPVIKGFFDIFLDKKDLGKKRGCLFLTQKGEETVEKVQT